MILIVRVLHADLQKLAQLTGKSDRFTFIPSIPNDDLCRMLPGFDLLAYHSDYPELSKVVIEGALTGLPMVVNRRKGEEVPELKRGICVLVEDTESGYGDAIAWLIQDSDARERLGREARNHANAHWSPAAAENNYVRIYRKILAAAPSSIPR